MTPRCGMEVADHAPELLAREGVERAERLVEHQQLRLVDERAAERGALLHAAGELPGILVALPLSPTCASSASARATYSALCARRRERCGWTISSGSSRFWSVVRQGSMRRVLEGHAGELDRRADLAAVDDHRAGARELQAGGELHQGGLAAAGRADDRRELALADLQRQPVHRRRAVLAPA